MLLIEASKKFQPNELQESWCRLLKYWWKLMISYIVITLRESTRKTEYYDIVHMNGLSSYDLFA